MSLIQPPINTKLIPAIFVSCFALAASALMADAKGRTDWAANCDTLKKTCVLSQTAMASDRIWLGTVRVLVDENARAGNSAAVEFLVPAGVHLTSGLFAAVGPNNPKQATWIRCSPKACLAQMNLSKKELSYWKRANNAELRYRPRAESKVAVFNISLIGLTAGLKMKVSK